MLAGTLVLSVASVVGLPSGALAHAAAAVGPDVTARPDVVSATLTARLEHHRVEATGLRTGTTTTYANPDGTLTQEIASGPVRVKDPISGAWTPIDTTLTRDNRGVHPRAAAGDTVLSGGGSGPFVSGTLPSGERVGLSWPTPLPAPVLNGDSATYSHVLGSADLVVQVRPAGFEFSLVLHDRPAGGVLPPVPFAFSAPGLTVGTSSAGGLQLTDHKGAVVAGGGSALMWSDDKNADGTPSKVTALGLSTTESAGQAQLLLSPNNQFLNDPAVTYPVVLDPTLTYGRASDTYAESNASAAVNFNSSTVMMFGARNTGSGLAASRAFLTFNPSGLSGKHVLSASLNVYQNQANTCTAMPTYVDLITQSWNPATLTWLSGQPSTQAPSLSSQSAMYGYTGCGTNWLVYNGLEGTVQGWVNGTLANYGLRLHSNETSSTAYRRLDSGDSTGSLPFLSVTYNTPPNTPTLSAPATGSFVPGSSVTLQANATDPDGDPLTGHWFVQDTTTGAMVVSGATSTALCGSLLCYTVSGLTHTDSYQWQLYTTDAYDSSPYSATWAFTDDGVAPAAPAITSSTYSSDPNTWTAPSTATNNFSWTGSDSGSGIAYWQYGQDVTPPTTNTSATSLTWNPAAGPHTLYVRAVDNAGNVGPTTSYSFQIGSGAVTSPSDQDRTQASVSLTSTAPSTYTGVAYSYRRGSSGPFTQVPTADVTVPGSTSNPTWPYPGSSGSFSALNWNLAQTIRAAGGSDGLVQLEACFYASGQPSPSACSAAVNVQFVSHAFGASYATPRVGPGLVSLLTGDYEINQTDAAVPSYTGSLSIGRSLTTLDPANSSHNMLSPSQHNVESDLSGFTAGNTTLTTATNPTILGAASLSIAPNGSTSGTTDTYAAIGGDTGALRLGLTPGHTYTLSGYEYVPAGSGLTSDQVVRGQRLVAFTRVGSSSYAEADGTAPTATNTWSPVSVTFQVPAGATEAFVRVYNGFASTKTGSVVYYDNLTLSRDDIFGPGWTAALPGPGAGAADMTLEDDSASGYVLLTAPDGGNEVYLPSGSNTFAGIGDAHNGSVLTKVSATQFTLTDTGGTATTWKAPSTGLWQVSSVMETGSAKTTTYTYDGAGRPIQILGPVPPGVDCTTPLTRVGCRTMTLSYANATTATGTTTSTWGDVVGLLTSVDFTAADPTNNNLMTRTSVASYAYDVTGHLRAAWDPRVSPALKTTYAYNPDGRIANLTPAGLNPFSFGYDTTGRLNSLSRPNPAGGTDTQTVVYDLPVSSTVNGVAPPVPLGSAQTGSWGQTSDLPLYGAAIFPASHGPAGTTPTTVPSTDWPFAHLHYLDVNGREVNSASYGAGTWQVATSSYNHDGNVVRSLDPGARDEALNPSSYPHADPQVTAQTSSALRAGLLDTQNTYSADGTELVATLGPIHPVTLASGTVVDGRSHTVNSYDQGAPAGGPYRLVTTSVSAVQTPDGVDHDSLTTLKGYDPIVSVDTSGWTLRTATSSTTVMSGTPNIVHVTRYDAQGQVIETRMPAGTGGGDAHSTITTYYTAGTTAGCVNTAMVGLVCQTAPAAQPSTGPALPTATMTYDRWAQPTQVVETANGATTTTSTVYDSAGRPCLSASTSSGANLLALPGTYTGFDPLTGLPTVTGTLTGTLPASCPSSPPALAAQVSTGYDSDGRLTSYQDADGNVATTSYTQDGQVAQHNDGKATTSYGYDSSTDHRGLLLSQADAQVGTFTATYDAAGQQTSRTYPTGLVGSVGYDDIGQPTQLSYAKSGSTWMTFSEARNGRGQVVSQSSPNSSQTFGYDNAGRLSTVADTDRSSGSARCTSRAYAYDLDSNRVRQDSYAPTSSGSCSTGTTDTFLTHTYDQADRLTDAGIHYDSFGNTTALIEAPLDLGTGANGALVVDGASHPQGNPLLLSGSLNYTSLTLQNGGWISVASGSGGALQLKVQGTLSICSSCGISSDGAGGAGAVPPATAGTGVGAGQSGSSAATYGGGGGGAGNATVGSAGAAASGTGVLSPGAGGAAGASYGDISGTPTLASLVGSGGGAGGAQVVGSSTLAVGGAGGAGGGVLRISAGTITDQGALNSQGLAGAAGATSASGGAGSGGGGGGGAVWLSADNVSLPTSNAISTRGGFGPAGSKGNHGGSGALGRVRIDAAQIDNTSGISAGQTVLDSPQLGSLSYYLNNMVANHTINGVTNSWTLDPTQRQHTESTGATGLTATNHYADSSDSPAWTANSDNSWTRNAPGIDGGLAAIVDNTGKQELQLTDPHGDIVATTPNSSTATGVDSYNESTEFGAPRSGTSAKYGWLGGKQRSTDTLGGIVLMGVRLYAPALGRFLQTDPVAGGSANPYDYVYQDPINKFDLDGRMCWSWGGCKKEIGHAWHATTHAVNSAAGYVWDRRGTIASGVAMAACFGGPLACGIAQGSAWLIRSQQRGYSHWRVNAEDGIWTGATFGLGQAFRIGGRGLQGLAKWAVKGAAALPSAVRFGGCRISHGCDF